MKARQAVVGVVLLALGAAGGALGWRWYFGADGVHHDAAAPEEGAGEKKAEPAALVVTAVATQEVLHPTIEALGSVMLAPTAVWAVVWPSELSVIKVLVAPGQTVEKDAPLVQVAASRDAETQALLAAQTAESADRALDAAKQRVERGLAARPELIAAEAVANEARQRLERLKAGAPPADGMIRTSAAGVVQAVRAQAGSVAGANTSLVDIAPGDGVVVLLGVEPARAPEAAVGQRVMLAPVDVRDPSRFEAVVSLVAPMVNPATRLVDVTATFAAGPQARVGTMLRGELALPEARVVIVPRAAVVPDGDKDVVFVVKEGKAVRAPVVLGRRSGDRVEVVKGCEAGDRVVVMGQSQLTDGAAVRQGGAVEGH